MYGPGTDNNKPCARLPKYFALNKYYTNTPTDLCKFVLIVYSSTRIGWVRRANASELCSVVVCKCVYMFVCRLKTRDPGNSNKYGNTVEIW